MATHMSYNKSEFYPFIKINIDLFAASCHHSKSIKMQQFWSDDDQHTVVSPCSKRPSFICVLKHRCFASTYVTAAKL